MDTDSDASPPSSPSDDISSSSDDILSPTEDIPSPPPLTEDIPSAPPLSASPSWAQSIRCSRPGCRLPVKQGGICAEHRKKDYVHKYVIAPERARREKVMRASLIAAPKCVVPNCGKWEFYAGLCRPHSQDPEIKAQYRKGPISNSEWKVDRTASDFKVGDVAKPLKQVQNYQHYPGGFGSIGVFAIKTEDGIMIAKAATQVEKELFALSFTRALGNKLKNGWITPKVRLLDLYGRDFKQLQDSMTEIDKSNTLCPGADTAKIARLGESFYIQLLEYIPGTTLDKTPRDFPFQSALRSLGGVLLLDVLIHNWDRMPHDDIFKTEGNIGNILILENEKKKVSISLIDQFVTPINVEKNKISYLKKAASLVRSVSEDHKLITMEKKNGKSLESMVPVKKFIERYTKSDFGQAGESELVLGFIEALEFLYQSPSSSTTSEFDHILKETEEEVRYLLWGERMTGSRQKMESINEITTFIRDVWTSITSLLPKTVLRWDQLLYISMNTVSSKK